MSICRCCVPPTLTAESAISASAVVQIIHTEFVLVTEDMGYKDADCREITFSGRVADGGIFVEECADNRLIAHMSRNTAEPVILGDTRHKILTVVLTDSLDCPRYAAPDKFSGSIGSAHQFVVGCADAFKAVFGFGN